MACDQRKVQLRAGLWCNVPIHTLYCVNGRLNVAVLQLLYCVIVRGYVLYRQYRVACDQRKVQLTAGLWCNVPIITLCVNGRLSVAVLQLLYCAVVRGYVLYRQYSVACDQRKVQLTAGLWCNVPIHTLYCVNGRLNVAVLQLLYCVIVRGYVLYRQYRVACDQRKVQLTAGLWCNVPINKLFFVNCIIL